MQVKRLAWLGTRTERFDETVAFFRDVLGLPLEREKPGFAMFRLPAADNDYVEVFGSESSDFPFFTTGPVVGLLVDDLGETRAALEAAGAKLIDDVQWPESTYWPEDEDGYGWFHFRGPDGNVYSVVQGSELVAG